MLAGGIQHCVGQRCRRGDRARVSKRAPGPIRPWYQMHPHRREFCKRQDASIIPVKACHVLAIQRGLLVAGSAQASHQRSFDLID